MPALLVVLSLAGAGALAYWLLAPNESESDEANKPVPVAPPERASPTPTTGTLIIRVRTPDSMALPSDTKAGYVDGGERRLRPAARDGTFRFSDAPLGRIEVVATAEGYRDGTSVAVVQALVPTEVLVTLEPKP
jgi:hypothetical protein